MILVADSGSTKTDWRLIGDNIELVILTQGISPIHQNPAEIENILRNELLKKIGFNNSPADNIPVDSIYFYGSGCRADLIPSLKEVFKKVFPKSDVEVCSDLLAAARALLGNNEGIACILGTGANSCYYDGEKIIKNTPALGYILGDEGSGAVLGKNFINALFKGQLPQSLIADMNLDINEIINKVYRQPLANRYLASLAPLIKQHIETEGVRELIIQNFVDFFKKNIDPYQMPETPVNVVGSIAYFLQPEFKEAAGRTGHTVGTILRAPIDALVKYHEK